MSLWTYPAVSLVLIVLGAHVVVPRRLAPTDGTTGRERWGLAALPLLLVACLVAVLRLSNRVDLILDAGWNPPGLAHFTARILAILIPSLILIDVVVCVGRRKLEPVGFRLVGWFAVLPLAAVLWTEEVLARGEAAVLGSGLLLATLSRLPVALGAAEALAPMPKSGRPVWTVPAALGLVAWVWLIPRDVFERLLETGALVPLGAAAVLFLGARWIPPRLRRPTILAAALLASLAFAWAGSPPPETDAMELAPQSLPAPPT